MTEQVIKILNIFNKPIHYLIIGLILIFVHKDDSRFWGFILVGIAIASFIEFLYKLCKQKRDDKNELERERLKAKQKRELLFREYDSLSEIEKIIVFTAVVEKVLAFPRVRFEKYALSLSFKGFGHVKGDSFILKYEYLLILENYEAVQNDYNTYYCDEEEVSTETSEELPF